MRSKGFTLIEIMIVVVVIGLLAVIALPSFLKARADARKNMCINNLRVIEAAKEQWALAYNKAPGEAVDEAQVNTFIKKGAPRCPGAGVYAYGAVGVEPQCSLAGEGHAL